MPWEVLREAAPAGKPPQPGEQWRVNFSRVEWQTWDRRRRLRQGVEARQQAAAAGEQLGVEPARRHQHAHARALGLCAVLVAGGWFDSGGGVRRRIPTRGSSGRCAGCIIVSAPFRTKTGRYAERLAELDASGIGVDGLEFRPEMKVDRLALRDRRARIWRAAVPHRSGRPRVGDETSSEDQVRR